MSTVFTCIMKNFSENLKKLRNSKKIMQSTLAEYCKVSVRQIIRYEQGVSEPTLSVLISLADFFNVSLDELVGR